MEACATVAVERSGDRTVATTLRSAPPLTLRRTGGGIAGTDLTVHLVGSAAGPVGGDDLRLHVSVGPGASLRVASVAASLAYPGPTGRPSHLRATATVAPGATLVWEPEPVVLVRGCDHRTTTHVTLAAGATLAWREVVVLGRHGEATGSLIQRLRVDLDGRPLLRNDLAVGPRWPASQGPAGVHDARVLGTLLVVGRPAEPLAGPLAPRPGVRTAAFPLGNGDAHAVLVSALGDGVEAVASTLARVQGSCETRTQSTSR